MNWQIFIDDNFTEYDVESYRAKWISEYPESITYIAQVDVGYLIK